jgi:dTDP-4-dehydrorhamnose reductase
MILLLGATGYIGQAFATELRQRGWAFVPLTRTAVDYTSFDTLFQYVRRTNPSLIINAAGYPGTPDIDDCEIHRSETVQANTLLPQTVARVCYLTKTPWAHVSSGCIYSGAKVAENGGCQVQRDLSRPEIHRLFEAQPARFRGFVESDEPNFSFRSPPCSFYSGTKALAEEALRWFNQTYLWRPALVFDEGAHPRNLLSKMQASPKTRDSLYSLSHRGDFVRACLDLWDRRADFGAYNVVNPGIVTSRQIIEAVRRILKPDRRFEFWKNDEELHQSGIKAPQASCILDVSKLLATGVRLRPVHEALHDALERWNLPDQNQGSPQAF